MSRRPNRNTLVVALLAPPAAWVSVGQVGSGAIVYVLGVLVTGFCLGLSVDIPGGRLAVAGLVVVMSLGAFGIAVTGTRSRSLLLSVLSALMICTFWPAVLVT